MGQMLLTPLEKALRQLQVGLEASARAPENELLRDGVIQRFEYTFELAWKFLKRQLTHDIANRSEVEAYSKKQLFRIGAERGLINDVSLWFDYLEKRNLTAHTYNEQTAELVIAIVERFARSVRFLLDQLVARAHAD